MKNTAQHSYLHLISRNDMDSSHIGVYGRDHAMLCSSGVAVQKVLFVNPSLFTDSLQADSSFSNRLNAALIDLPTKSEATRKQAIRAIERMVEQHRFSRELVLAIQAQYQDHMKRSWFWLQEGAVVSQLPDILLRGEAVLIDTLRVLWAKKLGTMLGTSRLVDVSEIYVDPVYIRIVDDFMSSGVVTTRGMHGEKDHLHIEVTPGVWRTDGTMKRDRYVWSKTTESIVSRVASDERTAVLYNRHGVAQHRRAARDTILDDSMVALIAKVARAIHNYYLSPQRVYFYIDTSGNVVVLHTHHLEEGYSQKSHDTASKTQVLATGISVVPGIVTGPVRFISNMYELRKLKKDEIAWLRVRIDLSDPQLLSSALGVVSSEIDPMSRLGFLVRDAGIPTLFGVGPVSFVTGHVITLDAVSGCVMQPVTYSRVVPKQSTTQVKLSSASKLYAYLHDVEQLHHPSIDTADAFVFSSHAILADLGYAAQQYRTTRASRLAYEQRLDQALSKIVERVGQREVVFAASDLTTRQWKYFPSGSVFEPDEANSMIGYRGALRVLISPELFNAELNVLARLRRKGARSLSLCLPYTRDVSEAKQLKRMVVSAGMHRGSGFKLYVSVATPHVVSESSALANAGIDGLMVDTETLLSLYTGTDYRNPEIAPYYSTSISNGVLAYAQSVLEKLAATPVDTIVGSQMISHNADMVTTAIHAGVKGIIVDPSAIVHKRELVYSAEKSKVAG